MATKCILMVLLAMHLAAGDKSIADVTNKYCEGVDVVFLLDTSRSIGIKDFKYELNFASDLVDQFDIGRGESQTRVAVVTMGHKPYMQFYLRRYGSRGKLKFAIQNIRHRYSSLANASAAIDFTSKFMFNTFFGGRNNTKHVMIVITDGLTQIQKGTQYATQRARERGIEVFSICIGPMKIKSELERFTDEAVDRFTLMVPNYKAVETIKSSMPNTFCDVPKTAQTIVTTVEPSDSAENANMTAENSTRDTENTTSAVTESVSTQPVSESTNKPEVNGTRSSYLYTTISNENETSSSSMPNENITDPTTMPVPSSTANVTDSAPSNSTMEVTTKHLFTADVSTTHEPLSTTEESPQKLVSSSHAAASTSYSEVRTESPFVETKSPWVNTDSPMVETKSPWDNTNPPRVETKYPWVNTDSPRVETKSPWDNTDSPWVNTNSPWVETKSPWDNTNSPWVETRSPWDKTNSPWVETKSPWDNTNSPWVKTNSPWAETNKPIEETSTSFPWPKAISDIFKKQFKQKIAEKARKQYKTFDKTPREDMFEKPGNSMTDEFSSNSADDNRITEHLNDLNNVVKPDIVSRRVVHKITAEDINTLPSEEPDKFLQKMLSEIEEKENLAVNNDISNEIPLDLAIKDDPRQYCGEKDVDIFFALDSSSSIWPEDFKKQIIFVNDLVQTMDFRRTRIGVLVYSNEIHMKVALDSGWTKQQIMRQISSIDYVSGLTNTSDAIMYLRKYGFTKENSRDHAMKLGIVLTDGISRDPIATKEESKKCREDGIVLFAIGIGKYIDKTELKRIANDPDDKYVFHVNGFGALASIRSEVAISACGAVPDQPMPLMSCGTGVNADVLFVYDAPALGARKSSLITTFVHDVSRSLQLSPEHLRIGRRTDNCPFISDIGFRSSSDKSVFASLQFPGIETLISKLWTAFPGRIDSKNLAVVFVDESTQNIEEATKILKNDKNFKVLVVAIGDPSFSRQARDLASQPINEYFVNIPSYMSLGSTQYELLQKLCYLITNKSMYQQDMRYRVREETWLEP